MRVKITILKHTYKEKNLNLECDIKFFVLSKFRAPKIRAVSQRILILIKQ